MSNKNNGLDKTLAAFDRLQMKPRETIMLALIKAGHELADTQRGFAELSRKTGALIDSIAVTEPGRPTPPYSQPGGSRIAAKTEVIITVGNTDVRYAHLVEYGTSKAAAQPFFYPGLRLTRPRLQAGIDRVGRKAIKDAWNGK